MSGAWFEAREARDRLVEAVFEEIDHRGWARVVIGETLVVEGLKVPLSDFRAHFQRTLDHLDMLHSTAGWQDFVQAQIAGAGSGGGSAGLSGEWDSGGRHISEK